MALGVGHRFHHGLVNFQQFVMRFEDFREAEIVNCERVFLAEDPSPAVREDAMKLRPFKELLLFPASKSIPSRSCRKSRRSTTILLV